MRGAEKERIGRTKERMGLAISTIGKDCLLFCCSNIKLSRVGKQCVWSGMLFVVVFWEQKDFPRQQRRPFFAGAPALFKSFHFSLSLALAFTRIGREKDSNRCQLSAWDGID